MCLFPHRIINPSRYIDPNSCQSLFLYVPCNHCSECLAQYNLEWRNRALYEFQHCKFVLFDTLTYRNGSLPHLSDYYPVSNDCDFPCFSVDHIQKFIKKLRSSLDYAGYDVDGNFRYLVACEYGSDIRRSRRPHYHLLLFINFEIDPCVLSSCISDCWIHGRTDGVDYRGRSYVLNRCVFKPDSFSSKIVVNYVTKYISKQFFFQNLL